MERGSIKNTSIYDFVPLYFFIKLESAKWVKKKNTYFPFELKCSILNPEICSFLNFSFFFSYVTLLVS